MITAEQPTTESTITIVISAAEVTHFAACLEIAAVVADSRGPTYKTAARILRTIGHRVPVGTTDERDKS